MNCANVINDDTAADTRLNIRHLAISEQGLKSRAKPGQDGLVPNEVHFLDALKESLETGQTQADELLARYHSDWNGDVSKVFGDYSY